MPEKDPTGGSEVSYARKVVDKPLAESGKNLIISLKHHVVVATRSKLLTRIGTTHENNFCIFLDTCLLK